MAAAFLIGQENRNSEFPGHADQVGYIARHAITEVDSDQVFSREFMRLFDKQDDSCRRSRYFFDAIHYLYVA